MQLVYIYWLSVEALTTVIKWFYFILFIDLHPTNSCHSIMYLDLFIIQLTYFVFFNEGVHNLQFKEKRSILLQWNLLSLTHSNRRVSQVILFPVLSTFYYWSCYTCDQTHGIQNETCNFYNYYHNFHKYIRTSNYDNIHVDIDVCTDNIKPNFPVIFIILLILLQILISA